MCEKVDVIAYKIIEESNKQSVPITSLRLQRLLYFTQAIGMRNFNRNIFEEDFEAWTYGPTIPSIYNKFAHMGALPLEVNDTININNDIELLIKEIVAYTKGMSDGHLVNIVHNQSPWRNAYSHCPNSVISKDSIRKQFEL